MKTTKFSNMISTFCCDFVLARSNKCKLSELDAMIDAGDKRLLEDIKLLEELEFLLRTGKAEIHIVGEFKEMYLDYIGHAKKELEEFEKEMLEMLEVEE